MQMCSLHTLSYAYHTILYCTYVCITVYTCIMCQYLFVSVFAHLASGRGSWPNQAGLIDWQNYFYGNKLKSYRAALKSDVAEAP